MLGRIGKVSACKNGQRSVTSLSSHYWCLQSCCGHVAGSQAPGCAPLPVRTAAFPTPNRGNGNTRAQGRGCKTSLWGLTRWSGGRSVLHGIPGTSTGFSWEAKPPEAGPGCQAETSRRRAVLLWLPLTGLEVPRLQANPHPPLLGCGKASCEMGGLGFGLLWCCWNKRWLSARSNGFQGEKPVKRGIEQSVLNNLIYGLTSFINIQSWLLYFVKKKKFWLFWIQI